MTSWLFQSAGVYTQFFRIFSPRRDLAPPLELGLAQRMEGRRRPNRSDSSIELRSRPKFRCAAPFREGAIRRVHDIEVGITPPGAPPSNPRSGHLNRSSGGRESRSHLERS